MTNWPLVRMPLPASGNHCQSLPVCAPYFAIEKLASFARFGPSLATQSSIGMVNIGCAPAARALAMNVSPLSPGVADVPGMLSKYQSCRGCRR